MNAVGLKSKGDTYRTKWLNRELQVPVINAMTKREDACQKVVGSDPQCQ